MSLDNSPVDVDEFFDEDGYPNEHALDTIAKWDWRHTDECFEFVRQMWRWNDIMWTQTDDGERIIYHISTGGWSGNESLVMALRENHVIWMFTWVQSQRGGHHIFELPYKRQPSMVGKEDANTNINT
jgi:hypothetical protein